MGLWNSLRTGPLLVSRLSPQVTHPLDPPYSQEVPTALAEAAAGCQGPPTPTPSPGQGPRWEGLRASRMGPQGRRWPRPAALLLLVAAAGELGWDAW